MGEWKNKKPAEMIEGFNKYKEGDLVYWNPDETLIPIGMGRVKGRFWLGEILWIVDLQQKASMDIPYTHVIVPDVYVNKAT